MSKVMYRCPVCSMGFMSLVEVSYHIREQHGSYEPNRCWICGEKCESEFEVVKHICRKIVEEDAQHIIGLTYDMFGIMFIREQLKRYALKLAVVDTGV